jgi:hypothetical protein
MPSERSASKLEKAGEKRIVGYIMKTATKKDEGRRAKNYTSTGGGLKEAKIENLDIEKPSLNIFRTFKFGLK